MCNAISGCLSGLGHNPARHLLALLRDDGPVFVGHSREVAADRLRQTRTVQDVLELHAHVQ